MSHSCPLRPSRSFAAALRDALPVTPEAWHPLVRYEEARIRELMTDGSPESTDELAARAAYYGIHTPPDVGTELLLRHFDSWRERVLIGVGIFAAHDFELAAVRTQAIDRSPRAAQRAWRRMILSALRDRMAQHSTLCSSATGSGDWCARLFHVGACSGAFAAAWVHLWLSADSGTALCRSHFIAEVLLRPDPAEALRRYMSGAEHVLPAPSLTRPNVRFLQRWLRRKGATPQELVPGLRAALTPWLEPASAPAPAPELETFQVPYGYYRLVADEGTARDWYTLQGVEEEFLDDLS